MSAPQPATTSSAALPEGTWHVDPNASSLAFSARGMFGLVAVHGAFDAYQGEIEIKGAEAHGELRIQAATLDTKNEQRDSHLRSADFFDVATHPAIRFTLIDLTPRADGTLELTGTLRVRDQELRVVAPVHLSKTDSDHLRIDTTFSVDREAAGVGWSKMGLVRGKARLTASLGLVRI